MEWMTSLCSFFQRIAVMKRDQKHCVCPEQCAHLTVFIAYLFENGAVKAGAVFDGVSKPELKDVDLKKSFVTDLTTVFYIVILEDLTFRKTNTKYPERGR